jgi:Eco29kI restriction endonuclease
MASRKFDRAEHVYKNEEFAEMVKDAVRFFNGTPVHPLPPLARFRGTGVYALYYTGRKGIYAEYGKLNRTAYEHPIYVGKAVPKGWRQARVVDDPDAQATELQSRLREHGKNIDIVSAIDLSDFSCRFVILEGAASDMIGTIEAALIKLHKPLWNTGMDGFGNHTPGKGRFEQAKSHWDVIHVGRDWAEKCKGAHAEPEVVLKNIKNHFKLFAAKP